MNISVFGMGYVGVVTAACLAREGHFVTGVDVVQEKIDLINAGKSPIVEPEIEELVRQEVGEGRLQATHDVCHAVDASDIAIICVGTPSREDGALNTEYIESVTLKIGENLRERKRKFCFVLRSTVLPGTVNGKVIPLLEEASGKKVGDGIDILFHPEFLREGSSVRDFYCPPKIVIGEAVEGSGKTLMELYKGISAPCFFTEIEVAEMVKYSDNIFHAAKITFANEIGQICFQKKVDSRRVMEIFCADTKLNISPAYLKPGFAFGGSCLPKDLRAIVSEARRKNIKIPMLENILESNRLQIERVLSLIIKSGPSKIGLAGLSFKSGTDDLRESPFVQLSELLLGKGYELRIFDECVRVEHLIGRNKAYIDRVFPHLASLLVPNIQAFDICDTILINHRIESSIIEEWLETDKYVFDLTGSNVIENNEKYIPII